MSDPSEFGAATPGDVDEAISEHAAAEGAAPPSGGGRDVMDRLMATEGGEDLQTIKQDYSVSTSMALIIRGSQKMANVDGMPAIADVVIGVVLEGREMQSGKSTESSGQEDDELGIESLQA